jgi:uncharacterized protein YndB with AHSA1/START domain
MVSMTTNPPSVVDADTFTVRRTIRIAASVEKVWAAVTEPEHISRWFGQAEFDGSGTGAQGKLTFGTVAIPVRIEAIDPQRSVSYRWTNDDASAGVRPTALDEAASTVFTFTLEAVPGGTQLTVVETGFETTSDPLVNLEAHRGGWNEELDKLVALLEVGP